MHRGITAIQERRESCPQRNVLTTSIFGAIPRQASFAVTSSATACAKRQRDHADIHLAPDSFDGLYAQSVTVEFRLREFLEFPQIWFDQVRLVIENGGKSRIGRIHDQPGAGCRHDSLTLLFTISEKAKQADSHP